MAALGEILCSDTLFLFSRQPLFIFRVGSPYRLQPRLSNLGTEVVTVVKFQSNRNSIKTKNCNRARYCYAHECKWSC